MGSFRDHHAGARAKAPQSALAQGQQNLLLEPADARVAPRSRVPAQQGFVARQLERQQLDIQLVGVCLRDPVAQHRGMVAVLQLVHDLAEAGDGELCQALTPLRARMSSIMSSSTEVP